MIHNFTDVQNFPGKGVGVVSDVLGDLMNLVPLPGKITIIPVKNFSSTVPVPNGPPYITMFNPETISFTDQVQLDSRNAQGNATAEQIYIRQLPKVLTIDILIDGTGASGEKREVTAEIALFNQVTGFNGNDHKSNELILIFGEIIFSCMLTNATVKYSLFRPNGTPLRATVSATFKGHTPKVLGLLEANLMSADLTHKRYVKAGDRLDNICNNIYDSPRFVTAVAQANNLTSIRKLREGSELHLPPIEK